MELRPYQQEDVHKALQRSSYGLFSEQRTGKTPIALIAAQQKGCRRILIVTSKTLANQWKNEVQTWLNKPSEIYVPKTNLVKEQIVIINYEKIRMPQTLDRIVKWCPDAVLLDEAHRIKDRQAAITKAMYRLAYRSKFRIPLTGTPGQDKPWDLFPILKFMEPQQYSSYHNFLDEYFDYIKLPHNEFAYEVKGIRKDKESDLAFVLSHISAQRKRVDVMPWLKDLVETRRVVLSPTGAQVKYLKELEETFETEHINTANILERLVRVRQICLAPLLLKLKSDSPKWNYIKDYMSDYPEKSIIIFSSFTEWLKMLNKYDPSIALIIGETSQMNRNDIIKDFQAGKQKVIAIQIQTGKEGLNLDKADTVIFTDIYPPASAYSQAKDRLIPTSAERVDGNKEIIELCLSGTYDESLYNIVYNNISETDIINDYKKYLKGGTHGNNKPRV